MGYQYKSHIAPFELAKTVLLRIEPVDCLDSTSFAALIQRRLFGRVVSEGDKIKWNVCGRDIKCTIIGLSGSTSLPLKKIDRSVTHFEYEKERSRQSPTIDEEKDLYITSLTDMIRSSFENSEAYYRLGIPVAKSILIHGVSGVGKTRLVKRVSAILASNLYEISIQDLLSFNEDEYNLVEFNNYNPLCLTMNKAMSNTPSTVIIRDLDALGSNGYNTRKILDILAAQIARIEGNLPVCVIGLARQLRTLPELLQKTDIFRQHMTLPIPSLPQRKQLLNQFLQGLSLQTPNEDITATESVIDYYATQISMRTSGYVARDLKLLIRQAKLRSMRAKRDIADQLQDLSLTQTIKAIQWSDFDYALETCRPSQQTEVESTLPKRSWDDMGGYQTIKDRMKQAILLPLLQPEIFTKLGIKPPSGLLLYGPSGCGKTALVQALVSESMTNIISIKGPEIFSKYLGETENKIRKLFATAKRISPCIVFIDEMDAIGTKRGFDMGDAGGGGVNERVLSTLLNEMDGVEGRQGVVVIGCTNRPDQIDDAILRPGRLDQLVYVGLPTLEDRVEIIKTLMKHISIAANDIDPIDLAKQTEFCSGADLENLFREAGTAALRKDMNTQYITNDHIQSVIVSICERAEDQVLEGRLNVYEKFLHDHSL